MKRREQLKRKAQDVKQALAGTVSKAVRAARGERIRGGEGLGPDRGTLDQEEARLERAREQARKEARREARRERIKEAKAEEKKKVKRREKQRIEREQRSIVDALSDAMQTDFDGDGEVLAEEAGLQTEREARRDNRATAREIRETREMVETNRGRINRYHSRTQSPPPGQQPRRRRPPQGGQGKGSNRQAPRDTPDDLPPSPVEMAVEEFREREPRSFGMDNPGRAERDEDLPEFDVTGGLR
jgi:hypothetical protein